MPEAKEYVHTKSSKQKLKPIFVKVVVNVVEHIQSKLAICGVINKRVLKITIESLPVYVHIVFIFDIVQRWGMRPIITIMCMV